MDSVTRMARDLGQLWDRFFFAPQSFLTIGVFRFLVAINALIMYSVRLMGWRFFYTDQGPVQASWAKDAFGEFYKPFVFWFPQTEALTLGLHIAFVLALVLLCVGIGGRLTAIAVAILHLAFVQRNFTIVYGADRVTTYLFFFLVLVDNDRAFSLSSWLGWKKKAASLWNQAVSSIGVRLAQIQLCVIYGYTGMEKLKGDSWWGGTSVWSVVGNQQLMLFDLSWMRQFPLVIAAMTFSVLIFEVYFPVLVWIRATRPWLLIYGVIFHFFIGLLMGIPFFSGAMVAAYILFVEPEILRRTLEKLKIPSRWLSPANSSLP